MGVEVTDQRAYRETGQVITGNKSAEVVVLSDADLSRLDSIF
jgi:hypothetical protein